MVYAAAAWVGDLISNIVETFQDLGTAVFNFLKDGFVTLFLEVSEQGAVTGVSAFGIFSFVLIGIALCLGLTKYITSMVRRKI